MKKSHLLVSCAVAGLLLGSQAAMANHHEEGETKDGKASGKHEKDGKHSCEGKDGKHSCKGKEGKKDGKHSCGANSCDSSEE